MVLPSEVTSHTYTNTSNIVSLLSVHGILYIHSMPDVHKEYFATGFITIFPYLSMDIHSLESKLCGMSRAMGWRSLTGQT